MYQQEDSTPTRSPEKGKPRWGLIIVLAFSVLISIACFFYGLTRQFQAEAVAEMSMSRIENLEAQLVQCQNEAMAARAEAERQTALAVEALKK